MLIGPEDLAVVDAIKRISTAICETCGAPGTTRKVGPCSHVRCEEHAR